MLLPRKLAAEFLGTFWLVLGGTGAAVLAAKRVSELTEPGANGLLPVGIGYLGVSFAFGLTVLTGAYALGAVSGGHFNPAITIGAWLAGRFDTKDVAPYIVVQVIAGIAASGVLALIANGQPGWSVGTNGLAANGYGDHSPHQFNLASGFLTEVVMTFFFVIVILGVTSKRWGSTYTAPLAIGLALTLIHLISIPVTNTSVNPARSTGPAVLQAGWALRQLWMFWVAPIIGAVLAALFTRYVMDNEDMGPGAVEPEPLAPVAPDVVVVETVETVETVDPGTSPPPPPPLT